MRIPGRPGQMRPGARADRSGWMMPDHREPAAGNRPGGMKMRSAGKGRCPKVKLI
jgi:hypothetical protein